MTSNQFIAEQINKIWIERIERLIGILNLIDLKISHYSIPEVIQMISKWTDEKNVRN